MEISPRELELLCSLANLAAVHCHRYTVPYPSLGVPEPWEAMNAMAELERNRDARGKEALGQLSELRTASPLRE